MHYIGNENQKMSRVYVPSIGMSCKSHHTKGKIQGRGIGSVLLDGGIGGQSTYSSIDDYMATTGRNPFSKAEAAESISGAGMVGGARKHELFSKLKGLDVKKPKTSNIRFNL